MNGLRDRCTRGNDKSGFHLTGFKLLDAWEHLVLMLITIPSAMPLDRSARYVGGVLQQPLIFAAVENGHVFGTGFCGTVSINGERVGMSTGRAHNYGQAYVRNRVTTS